jgi:prefoldin subunit 5
MIQMLIKLGKFLEQRFPKKVLLVEADYNALRAKVEGLDAELQLLRADLKESVNSVEVAVSRIGAVETAAVHKEAVKTVISEIQKVKDEFASLKTSLGFSRQPPPEISMMLNGEPIGEASNG